MITLLSMAKLRRLHSRTGGDGVFRLVDNRSQPGDGKVFIITSVRPGDMDDPNINFGLTMGGSPGVVLAPNDNYTMIGKPAADLAKSLTGSWHPRVKPDV